MILKDRKQIFIGMILINVVRFLIAATFLTTQYSFNASDLSTNKMSHKAPYSS